ncbi:hypothetical protein C5S29_13685 [ANME-1 cluster archaeon GoMg3.2]|nr:hypothetical protein [ANME-1 cluster archaeon GoMg3.2]
MKGKAIIGISMAAIMIVSVLAATVPMVGASSDRENFNIIKPNTIERVLVGQNLEFQGFSGTVTIARFVSRDIENVYQADANNRIYNVNWPKSGAYYVAYNTADQAQLSVKEPDMPLELKVGTTKVASLAVGTKLTIDTGGMNLFPEDQVDLVIKGPDGQMKYDDVNDQKFTDITVAELNNEYGDNNLETAGWTIGAYTFQVKTDDVNACGLEAESVVRPLVVLKGEIAIEADMTSTVELDTIKLIVTGVAGDEINVAASPLSVDVVFKAGIDDTPMATTNQFNHTIDADGIRKYAVKFNDTGTYTIKVTVQSGPRAGDYDTVDITVSEKGVMFDLPSAVVIGEKLDIKGIANTGTYVDVFIDDVLYARLHNLVIEADGTFSKEVITTDVGMTVPGPVMLKAWIDCTKRPGKEPPTRSADGSAAIVVLKTHLDATITNTTVTPGDSFEVFGNASSDYVEIVLISPEGGTGTGMDGLYGTTIYTVPTFCDSTDYNYYKKIKVDSDADYGNYTLIVLNPGRDKAYGDSEYRYIDNILDLDGEGPEPCVIDVSSRTQEQIAAIISDMIYATDSDDFMEIGNIVVA